VVTDDNKKIEIDFNENVGYKNPAARLERIKTAIQQLKLAGVPVSVYQLSQLGFSRKKRYVEDLKAAIEAAK
jgi:hypothetical protein